MCLPGLRPSKKPPAALCNVFWLFHRLFCLALQYRLGFLARLVWAVVVWGQ